MPNKKKEKPLDVTNEKKPLDMTTDEAMEYLFGTEGAEKIKQKAQELNPPPRGKGKQNGRSVKSSRKGV